MSQFFTSGGQSVGASAGACLSNEYSEQTSHRIDWLDLFSVQGILKSSPNHSSKASILQQSAFFYSPTILSTRRTIALTRWIFVGRVMFLLFNMLSRLVKTFLPRNKHLLISWLQSPFVVILEPKSVTVCIGSPSICHEVMEPHAMILVCLIRSFKPALSLSSFTSQRDSIVLLYFLP